MRRDLLGMIKCNNNDMNTEIIQKQQKIVATMGDERDASPKIYGGMAILPFPSCIH